VALSTPVNRSQINSTTNTNTYAGSSGSPSADALLVAIVSATDDSSHNPDTPTVVNTPWGLTWARDSRGDNLWTTTGTVRRGGWVFYAMTTTAPGADTFDVNFVDAVTGCTAVCVEYTGADLSGGALAALVQCTVGAGSGTTFAPATLNAAGHADNRGLAAYAKNVTSATATIDHDSGGGWSELVDLSRSTPSHEYAVHYHGTGFDTTPTATPSDAASKDWGAWGLEIKAAVAAAGSLVVPTARGFHHLMIR
jgi:hypothetical protein